MAQKAKFGDARLKREMANSERSKTGPKQKLLTEPVRESSAIARTALEVQARGNKVLPKPENNQESEVRTMNDEGNASGKMFEGFSDMTSTLFNPENTRKIAKLWIENSERAADEILKIQAKATEWSKNTMLAPIFEMQNSIVRSCVEVSAKTARRLWQLE